MYCCTCNNIIEFIYRVILHSSCICNIILIWICNVVELHVHYLKNNLRNSSIHTLVYGDIHSIKINFSISPSNTKAGDVL